MKRRRRSPIGPEPEPKATARLVGEDDWSEHWAVRFVNGRGLGAVPVDVALRALADEVDVILAARPTPTRRSVVLSVPVHDVPLSWGLIVDKGTR